MPVVPFTSRPNQSQPIPKVDPTFLMMAAAELHEAGRLVEPSTKAPDLFETRPLASMGGRSIVESNNPELGPTDAELRDREKAMEQQRRNNSK